MSTEIKFKPEWAFRLEDSDKGLGLPLRGVTFVEPDGRYALIDSNGRIWVETEPESNFFESPCRRHCMMFIKRHPQSYKYIRSLEDF